MARSLPKLDLSHGQVAWCLAGGKDPPKILIDQLHYLRKLGIPFDKDELGQGRGVRVRYTFNHFIEVGIAHEGLRRRIEPRLLLNLLDERPQFHNVYRKAYLELAKHPETFEGAPYKHGFFSPDYIIEFADRYAKKPGIRLGRAPDAGAEQADPAVLDLQGGGYGRDKIPLKALMVRLLRFARIAPPIKPGPKH